MKSASSSRRSSWHQRNSHRWSSALSWPYPREKISRAARSSSGLTRLSRDARSACGGHDRRSPP
jgi:hypothetical protein